MSTRNSLWTAHNCDPEFDKRCARKSRPLKELDERGFFNPEKRQDERERFEIEKLFQEAQSDRSRLTSLAERLKQTGLFADYEDRFFTLVGR